MRRGFLLLLAGFALFPACDGPGPVGQPAQAGLSLELLTLRPLLARPWGLALDPTGKYLVVSSHYDNQIYLLDAETYQPVGDTIVGGKARGIVFGGAGNASKMFVAAEEHGLLMGNLSPEGISTLQEIDQLYATFVLQDAHAGGMYAVDPEILIRMGPDGSRLASRSLNINAFSGLATTRDGELVLAIGYDVGPRRLFTLDADDLALVAAVDLPPWAASPTQIIPLDGPRAAVIGGGHSWSPMPGPLVAIVDWEAGTVGPTIEVGKHPTREGFSTGYGNPWVQVDASTALIGTSHGILAVDTRTGDTSHVEGDFDDVAYVNECCSMVWDAGRKRLVVASSVVYPEPFRESGRLEVYQIR